MKTIISYFLDNPKVTNMIMFLIFASGIFIALTMQRQVDPTIDFDILQISTIYPGASPEDVEINVTNKIEDEILTVSGVKRITSQSMENISTIYVEIDTESENPEKTKTEIKDAVTRVNTLPSEVTQKPLVVELGMSKASMIELALTGDVSETELRKYAKDLESVIKEIPGVSEIILKGYRKREIKILADPDKMEKNSITFNEIIHAVKSRNIRVSGGTIRSYLTEKNVITLSEYEKPTEINNVIVRANYEGFNLGLSDVADIEDTFEDKRFIYRGDGQSAIGLKISAQSKADVIDLSDKINEKLEEYKKHLPANVKVNTVIDFSIYTRIFINIVLMNGFIGFILVVLILLMFLDFRCSFWAAFGIPFSFFSAMMLFPLFGLNLNTMTMGIMILVIGIVVDDAIVVSEHIYTLKAKGLSAYDSAIKGSLDMAMPIFAAVSTTILAFFPIVFIGGIMGKYMRSIPIVILLTLGFSLIEAIFFLPSHLKTASPNYTQPRRTLWINDLINFYQNKMNRLIKFRWITMISMVFFLITTLLLSAIFLRFSLMEQKDRDFFAVKLEAPTGTTIEAMENIVVEVEKLITENIPADAINGYSSEVGHNNVSGLNIASSMSPNLAAVTVYLVPAEDRDVKSETITDTLTIKLKEFSKKHNLVEAEISEWGGPPVGKPIEVILISNDDKLRIKYESDLIEFLKTIPHVRNIESSRIKGKEELRIELDYPMLARTGLTAMDVAQTVRTAFDGFIVTSVRLENEDVEFRLRLKNASNYHEADLLEMPVANFQNALVKMKHFAKLKNDVSPSVITHYDGKRSISITGEIDSAKTTSNDINKEIRKRFEKEIAANPGIRMKFAGEAQETEMSMRGYLFALAIATAAIYFILVILFKSYSQPFMILSVIPFAVGGVFFTLLLHNETVTIVGLLGLLGLIGVGINDSIVMIAHLNNKFKNRDVITPELVVEGASERLRPVVLTTLTTFVGLIPTAYGWGGGFPMMQPMALTLAWGLFITTMVTLIFIPMLYVTIAKFRK